MLKIATPRNDVIQDQ